jgi:hypothetical protein
LLTIVGFSAAGALGATALVLYLTDGRRTGDRAALAGAPAPGARAVTCALPF